MKTVGERLKYFIELQGFSLLSFAKKNDINYSGLTQIVNNKRPLGMEVLQQLKTSLPNLDTEWLLFDTKMREDLNSVEGFKTLKEEDLYYNRIDPGKEMLLKYLDDDEIKEKIIQLLNTKNK